MSKTVLINAGAGETRIAVVRTEVKNDAGARVLEVVTHHVARKRA